MPATFLCSVRLSPYFGWPASRSVHKIARRSMDSLPGSVTGLQTGTHSQMHRISRILEMESRHGITPAIRQPFRFSDESGRITAPLNSISKLRLSLLILVLRSLPSTCLLPGCGQWTILRQAAPDRSGQKPLLIKRISIAALASYLRY